MKKAETVNNYYDKVQEILSGANHFLEEKCTDEGESKIMIKLLIDCAHDAFIRGLPDEVSTFEDV